MAIASTNEGTPFVAILVLCNMSSTGMTISFPLFPNGLEQAAGIGVQHPKRAVRRLFDIADSFVDAPGLP
jgi:hypothetical protein